MAQWLSIRLQTNGCRFESRCCHLIASGNCFKFSDNDKSVSQNSWAELVWKSYEKGFCPYLTEFQIVKLNLTKTRVLLHKSVAKNVKQPCKHRRYSIDRCSVRRCQKMSRVSFEYLIHKISCPEVFCKKAVLRNFAKFTGNHLRQSVFLNKVAGLRLQVFSCEFCEISKNIFCDGECFLYTLNRRRESRRTLRWCNFSFICLFRNSLIILEILPFKEKQIS